MALSKWAAADRWWVAAALMTAVFAFLVVIAYNLPVPVDEVDYRNAWLVAHDILNYDRYDYIGMPLSVLLVPHIWLDYELGYAINMALNFALPMVVFWRYKVGIIGILAVYLSYPFLQITWTNNIEWLSLVAFLLPPTVGTAVLALKPQAIGGVVVIWFKRHGWHMLILLPVLATIVLLLWGFKPIEVMRRADVLHKAHNHAPWPFLIPVGMWLLWKAWREDDEFLAAAATPLLVPYIAGYSLMVTLTVLACKYPKTAAMITVFIWWTVVIEQRRYG